MKDYAPLQRTMLALIITSVIWALSFGLLGHYLTGIPSGTVAMLRLLGAFLVFLPFLRFNGRKYTWGFIGIGAVQFGGMYLCYTEAFHYLPSSQIALLTTLTPLYIILLNAILSKQKQLNSHHLIAALLAVLGGGGILWQGWESAEGFWLGCLLVQLSNICFAAGQVIYARLEANWFCNNERSQFAWLYLGAFLITIPGGLHGIELLSELTALQWGILIYLGAIASGACFFLWNYGARRVTPVQLSIMNNLKIPLATAASLFIFGESANVPMLLTGSALIASAFFFQKNMGL